MNGANPQRTQPFCQPFGNRRLLHCKSSKESDGRSTEVPAWEACGKVVKQERQDFWEFVVSPPPEPARASSSPTTLTGEISPPGRHPPQTTLFLVYPPIQRMNIELMIDCESLVSDRGYDDLVG